MAYPNVFQPETTKEALERLEKIAPETQAQWGKMNSAQMFAHLNIAYDIAQGRIENKVSGFGKFMLKLFVKNIVVGEKPYKKNSRTAPVFLISDEREFNKEKEALIKNINDIEKLGASHFEGRSNPGFGKLTSHQWSTLFSKHIDHHFDQFGA